MQSVCRRRRRKICEWMNSKKEKMRKSQVEFYREGSSGLRVIWVWSEISRIIIKKLIQKRVLILNFKLSNHQILIKSFSKIFWPKLNFPILHCLIFLQIIISRLHLCMNKFKCIHILISHLRWSFFSSEISFTTQDDNYKLKTFN